LVFWWFMFIKPVAVPQKIHDLVPGHFAGLEVFFLLGYVIVETDKISTTEFFSKNLRAFSVIIICSGYGIFTVVVQHFPVARGYVLYEFLESQ